MGNAIPPRLSEATGKVILPDGTIHHYDKPLTVAELMLEYPQQLVVQLQQPPLIKKPVALPADKKLEMNKVYMMLPMRRGKPAALSSEEARLLLLKANYFLKSKSLLTSSTGFIPFLARMCAADTRERHDYSLERIKKLEQPYKQEEATKPDYFSNVLDERLEFLSRQTSGKRWKPSLDTITEKTIPKRVRHWIF